MTIENFTPWTSLAGGVLIGLSAAGLMLFNGRIAGVSGIAKGILAECPTLRERLWRLAFLFGIVMGGGLMLMLQPAGTALGLHLNPVQMLAGGLLVGIGTSMGNGCTSGHGVCGLGRRSKRSLAAVLTFMGTGFATMLVMSQILGLGRY